MASSGRSHPIMQRSPGDKAPHGFQHWFPFLPAKVLGVSAPIYGLDIAGVGGHSVLLHSPEELDQKSAFARFSIALALLGIYFGEGLRERAPGGIGGYYAAPAPTRPREPAYDSVVTETIRQLEQANDPYQIQARFTLSRGLALHADPESAIIEFFKLFELYIKQLAFSGSLSTDARAKVLERKVMFPQCVKDDLVDRGLLTQQLVDLIFTMKEVRNRFVGHGGMRPALGELFGDPENYEHLLQQPEFQYDPYLHYGPSFFERFQNDITLVGGFLFAKMQGISPNIFVRPGCWYQGSSHVRDVLEAAGAAWISSGSVNFYEG